LDISPRKKTIQNSLKKFREDFISKNINVINKNTNGIKLLLFQHENKVMDLELHQNK